MIFNFAQIGNGLNTINILIVRLKLQDRVFEK